MSEAPPPASPLAIDRRGGVQQQRLYYYNKRAESRLARELKELRREMEDLRRENAALCSIQQRGEMEAIHETFGIVGSAGHARLPPRPGVAAMGDWGRRP